jgi:adenine-specific DNA-methyltransferase
MDDAQIERKRLGIYYTPPWLARRLIDWAVPAAGPILDPSFGGCAFLHAGLDKLGTFPVSHPGDLIFGCDVDYGAASHRQSLLARGVPSRNLRFRDFLSPETLTWLGSNFSCTVGNPPYVRHHRLADQTIQIAQELVADCGGRLPKMSSMWAYFAILSAETLRPGGRLALVLPGAILHADYGKVVLAQLLARFGEVRLLHSRERIFPGAEEETVILLASKRGAEADRPSYSVHESMSELVRCIPEPFNESPFDVGLGHKFNLLDKSVIDAWQTARAMPGLCRLGDIADVRIGVVTGDNDFFVRRHDDPILSSNAVRGRNIIARNQYLTGPVVTYRDIAKLQREGRRTKLAIITAQGEKDSLLRRALNAAQKQGVHKRLHCARRAPWYRIKDLRVPDLFMPYMSAEPRGLATNNARALCTNAIHRVYLKPSGIDVDIVALAESSWSELFFFEAELFGRSYGGSVLKIEPSQAVKMAVRWGAPSIQFNASVLKQLIQGRAVLRNVRLRASERTMHRAVQDSAVSNS